MNKSAGALTNSFNKSTMIPRTNRAQLLLIILVILGFVAYSLPWLTNPSVSLSPGAYDLAEWASLHPVVRTSNPPLLASFLLRLPLVCLAIIGAVGIFSKKPIVGLILVFLVGVALLPPLEFFTQYWDDPNYQQQFFLAAFTCVAGILAIGIFRQRYAEIYIILAGGIGAISSLVGLTQGYSLMRQFDLPTQIGIGGVALAGTYGAIILLGIDIHKANKVVHRVEQTTLQ